MADLIDDLHASIDRLVDADPSVLADGETLVRLHAELERLDAAVTRAVARFEAGGEWAGDGARTAAAWLSTRCRTPRPAARRRVGLARALRDMPVAEVAWLEGLVGRAQVATLRQALKISPELFGRDEERLVAQAAALQHRHLQRSVAYWCQLAEPDDIETLAARDRDSRRAHLSPGMRGTGFLDARLDPIGYDIVRRALRAIEDELFQSDWAEVRARLGDRAGAHDLARTPAQRRHDALVEMAKRAQALPPGARLPEPLFTVHLGLDAIARMCELADGTVLTPGALIPWVDQAWIERVVRDGPDRTVNLGIRQRLFTGGTRRAVEVRYRECYHPYCDLPAESCQIDHIEPYGAGGLTIDTNGRPACAFHNRLRHRRPDPPPADDDRPP